MNNLTLHNKIQSSRRERFSLKKNLSILKWNLNLHQKINKIIIQLRMFKYVESDDMRSQFLPEYVHKQAAAYPCWFAVPVHGEMPQVGLVQVGRPRLERAKRNSWISQLVEKQPAAVQDRNIAQLFVSAVLILPRSDGVCRPVHWGRWWSGGLFTETSGDVKTSVYWDRLWIVDIKLRSLVKCRPGDWGHRCNEDLYVYWGRWCSADLYSEAACAVLTCILRLPVQFSPP